MKTFIINLIRFYQRVNMALIAVQFPFVSWSGCRSWPTCSEYTITKIQEDGIVRGVRAGMRRVASCHPYAVAHSR